MHSIEKSTELFEQTTCFVAEKSTKLDEIELLRAKTPLPNFRLT